jgi:hypothetical protein
MDNVDACCEPDQGCLLEVDPALADCCRRDLLEQAYIANLKQTLCSADRTDDRINVGREAFVRDVAEAGRRHKLDTDSLASDSEEHDPGVCQPLLDFLELSVF